jgi:hypothetical protein
MSENRRDAMRALYNEASKYIRRKMNTSLLNPALPNQRKEKNGGEE